MIALLDINVLLALAWPSHENHEVAHRWFAANRKKGWATCPVTQSGFVRLSATRAVVGDDAMSPLEGIAAIERSTDAPEHHFWIQDKPVEEIHTEMMVRIMGPKQMSDAILLDLAIKNGGKLVTFDAKILHLLPKGSELRKHVEVIEA